MTLIAMAVYVGILKTTHGSSGASPQPSILADIQAPDKSPRTGDVIGVIGRTTTQFPTKLTHSTERYLYHILVDVHGEVSASVSLIFVCVAEPVVEKDKAFDLIERMQRGFLANPELLRQASAPAPDRAMQAELEPIILKSMVDSGFAKGDKLSSLKSQVTQVKEQMAHNVERVLQRGDQLDDLMDRSTDLEQSSGQFRVTARRVQRAMCCKNFKWTIIMVCVALVVVGAVIIIILQQLGVFGHKSSPSVPTTTTKPALL